jgi:hypothetical protein
MPKTQPQSYEAEQQRLKDEYEGKPKEDIHITAPQEPEVNPEVYKDVEPMLYRGFLTVSAEINGVFFVFKSLNHHEFELLRFSGMFRDKEVTKNFWDTFLAYGIFMVDGSNILSDRERWIPKLADTFSELPKEAKAKIVRHISEINRRSSTAVVLTEAYAMESVSRYRWMQLKGLDLTTPAVTGIEGTQRLGLNWAQQLWRALNLAEDRNEQHERDWENAKFIGSCFAGKGISRVYNQDTDRRRKEKEERISRKDKLLRENVLGEKVPEKTAVLPGAVIMAPRTVEELADQLEKDLRGDQDWHDKVVAEHERRVREQYQARQQQQEEAAKENAVQFGGRNVFGGSDLQGLTPQEVEERVRHVKQYQAQAAARMQVRVDDEKTEVFLDKWGVTGPEISSEISTSSRDITEAILLPQERNSTVTPFRRK